MSCLILIKVLSAYVTMADINDHFVIKTFTNLQVEVNRQDGEDNEHVDLCDRNLAYKYSVPVYGKPSAVAAELRSIALWLDQMDNAATFAAAVADKLKGKAHAKSKTR